MNKTVFLGGVIASLAVAGSVGVRSVSANEGTALLKGVNGGACFVASIFQDGAYRLLATCRDLKMALTPEKTFYVLWITNQNGEERRLGPVANGKFAGSVDEKFTSLKVTVETEGYPNKPSTDVVLAGEMRAIDFGGSVSEAVIATPTPTASKITTSTQTAVSTTETGATKASSTLGSMVSTIFKIVLFAFGILLVVVGVFSFLSRRRSL